MAATPARASYDGMTLARTSQLDVVKEELRRMKPFDSSNASRQIKRVKKLMASYGIMSHPSYVWMRDTRLKPDALHRTLWKERPLYAHARFLPERARYADMIRARHVLHVLKDYIKEKKLKKIVRDEYEEEDDEEDEEEEDEEEEDEEEEDDQLPQPPQPPQGPGHLVTPDEKQHLYYVNEAIILEPEQGLPPVSLDCFTTGLVIKHCADATGRIIKVMELRNTAMGQLDVVKATGKLVWSCGPKQVSLPRTSPLWKILPNVCLVKASEAGTLVIHGRRSKPDIDLYEDDGTIRGYYRVIQGYPQAIHGESFTA